MDTKYNEQVYPAARAELADTYLSESPSISQQTHGAYKRSFFAPRRESDAPKHYPRPRRGPVPWRDPCRPRSSRLRLFDLPQNRGLRLSFFTTDARFSSAAAMTRKRILKNWDSIVLNSKQLPTSSHL